MTMNVIALRDGCTFSFQVNIKIAVWDIKIKAEQTKNLGLQVLEYLLLVIGVVCSDVVCIQFDLLKIILCV